ncbi:MAG: DUF1552 domain-containing protein [Polyangiaceae bacterium]|nr:DUF1552 domain-containing protein [Polyangiaceae bacterium]
MRHNRRSLVRMLGLGAGAALFAPMLRPLIREADGQANDTRRVVFVLIGDGWPFTSFSPKELQDGIGKRGEHVWDAVEGPLSAYSTHPWMVPLSAYRDSVILLDGAENIMGQTQHSCGYQTLSCVETLESAEGGGAAGGITIDQWIAQKLGASSALPSVQVGWRRDAKTDFTSVFAKGRADHVPAISDPKVAFSTFFGGVSTGGTADVEAANVQLEQRALLSSLRSDVTRLQARLAGPEREKLDRYLTSLQALEKSASAFANVSCKSPPSPDTFVPSIPAPDASDQPVYDKVSLLWEMSAAAQVCGITRVSSLIVGSGNSHIFMPLNGMGHDGAELHGAAMDKNYTFLTKLVARLMEQLKAVPEGNGTMADNTLVVVTNDAAEYHHNTCRRVPVMLLAGKNIQMKTGGRFVRLPPYKHRLSEVWVAVSRSVGVDATGFAAAGPKPPKLDIAELSV